MRTYRAADFVDMPWKNGGGRTLQLAIHPDGATLDTFEWRVSIATVAQSGPFSAFPGCERTLMLLDGDGFELDIAGRKVVLGRPLEPVTFRGDAAVQCRLLGGPSRDFGVITRGVKATVGVQRVKGIYRHAAAPTTLVACLDGRVEAEGVALEALSLSRMDGAGRQITLCGDAMVVLIDIGRNSC